MNIGSRRATVLVGDTPWMLLCALALPLPTWEIAAEAWSPVSPTDPPKAVGVLCDVLFLEEYTPIPMPPRAI
jgi:hypothetical protein